MKSLPLPYIIVFFLNIKLRKSRLKKYLPVSFQNWLRIWRYNLLLCYLTLSGKRGGEFFKALKFLPGSRKRILFYPDLPGVNAVIYQICQLQGYRITADPGDHFDLAIRWKDATIYTPDSDLLALAEKHPVLNLRCTDIRKSKIDLVFQEVFGYGTLVDPRSFQGECVQKSELNARHNGKIVACPVETPQEGSVYQVLIDNLTEDGQALDIRLPILGGCIPFAALWLKPLEARFSTRIETVEMVESERVFSSEEIEKLLLFCEKMGLDYGELDVLRSASDGRIYVVDVNNTPTGPTREREDIHHQARVFAERFFPTGNNELAFSSLPGEGQISPANSPQPSLGSEV